tara:strand:- start:449 stop:619 length:171 start_codon:yes stop_codon:yes gene_type:complete
MKEHDNGKGNRMPEEIEILKDIMAKDSETILLMAQTIRIHEQRIESLTRRLLKRSK